MKKVFLVICLGILFIPVLMSANLFVDMVAEAAPVIQGRSTIYGRVYGDAGRPVADVYVELLDDFNASIRQNKTDASGRFQFNGLVDGRYLIKIIPGNTGYMEHTQQVVIASISSVPAAAQGAGRNSGSDNQHLDIALKLDQRIIAGPFSGAPAVVFVQDVPPAAQRNYEDGISYFRQKKEAEAFASMKSALEVFPNYYAALDRLGGEYAVRGTKDRSFYEAGRLLLAKAAEVNPRGYSSIFGLGWTQYHLGLTEEALASFEKAASLYGKGPEAYLWLGKAQRKLGKLDKAEEVLKRADQLANSKSSDIHWQLAGVYNDQKRFREAADQMELYLKNAPKGEDPEKIKNLIKTLRDKAK